MNYYIKMFQLDRLWNEIKDDALSLIDSAAATGLGQKSKAVKDLETALSTYSNRKHVITTASCTDALTCAIEALNLPPKSLVAIQSLTFIAAATSIIRSGMIPYFIDVDECGHIKLETIPKNCSAVIVTDLWGCSIDYEKLQNWQKENPNIFVIMDAAQSIESSLNADKSLSQGIISVTSFSPSKTIPSWGSGGALLTDNDKIHNFAKKWITHGKEKNSDFATIFGANSTLGTLEAAQLLSVFISHKERHNRRCKIAESYINALKDSYIKPLPYRGIHTWHKFIIDCVEQREKIIEIFNANGIETKTFYQPLITDEPLYKDFMHTDMNCSNYFSKNLLAIPCQSTLNDNEIFKICEVLSDIK
ncbi:hypothetical protein EB001_00740 [bacterium]|nr:hypothetical protein [bacterium]